MGDGLGGGLGSGRGGTRGWNLVFRRRRCGKNVLYLMTEHADRGDRSCEGEDEGGIGGVKYLLQNVPYRVASTS